MPEEQHRRRIEQSTDRQELARVVLDLRVFKQLVGRKGRDDDRERGPILWRDVVEIVGCDHATTTWHIASDDRRVAGKMPAEMPREQASVRVIGAARPDRDDDRDGLAAIEIALLRGGRHQHGEQEQCAPQDPVDLTSASGHGLLTSRTLASALGEISNRSATTFCISSPLRGASGSLSWAASV